jgi:tRNA A-37 threonylcarbamoyl transferase component Bud32
MVGDFNEYAQGLWDFVRCERPDGTHYGTKGKCVKGKEVGYEKWNPIAEGNFGKVSINQAGTRVVKTLKEHQGKKGEFGPYEVELATKMGKLGHSPEIFSSSADHIEMGLAKGKPLWAGYSKGDDEPVMNATQAKQAASAIRDLHKMGFYHGDMHSQQFLVDGDKVQLVDYGLSGKAKDNPRKVIQDLNKIAKLVDWGNPDLAKDPYVEVVNRYRGKYAEAKGKPAKENEVGLAYLNELESL